MISIQATLVIGFLTVTGIVLFKTIFTNQNKKNERNFNKN